jgi:hypothetical protein
MSEQVEKKPLIDAGVIAKICHQANKALCEQLGDQSQKDWNLAEDWQRESAFKGVEFRIENPDAPNSAQHDAWMADKEKDGWVYGPVKDAEAKTHPCMVPYQELSEGDKAKDALFSGIVKALMPEQEPKEKKATAKKAADKKN